MMLNGFGVSGFRSFGPEVQFLYRLEKVNLVVGKNNVGKSNVLRLVRHFNSFLDGKPLTMEPLDTHQGEKNARFTWHLPFELSSETADRIARNLVPPNHASVYAPLIAAILDEFPNKIANTLWFPISNEKGPKIDPPDANRIFSAINQKGLIYNAERNWHDLWATSTGSGGGSFAHDWGPTVIRKIVGQFSWDSIEVHLLDAHRQIGLPGTSYSDLNGEGLISRLAELDRPDLAHRATSREKFAKITRFLADVLEEPDAQIETTKSGSELNIAIRGKVLPIQSLGTGVHEVLIFATAATVIEDQIICIEEPEIHLHPRLQRKLLQYLIAETNNQYFITTHSAALLDAPGTAIFHATQNPTGDTLIRKLDITNDRAHIGFDLGYRASDLVQSNAIIWVEGPSDRIYVRAWLDAKSNFSEGLHYSIMFYGGRLLSHLSVDDATVSDFIALQKINRHVAVIIDSDRRSAVDSINATKTRVLDEVERSGGIGWVTAGREIENYISKVNIERARHAVHSRTDFKNSKDQWSCAYEAKQKDFHADKIAIAREAVKTLDFNVLDLEAKLDQLVEFLTKANR